MAERTFSFLNVMTRPEAVSRLDAFDRLEAETVDLDDALGRVAAEKIISPEDLPQFTRSTVDGFAVRAKDTFGAGESSPGFFELVGESVMGAVPSVEIGPGQTARVWTGGMLPPGSDAVVMLEYSRAVDQTTIELTKAEAPSGRTIAVGEDIARGETVVEAGRMIGPAEIGLLAGLGIVRVPVVRRPVVGIISTGAELDPADSPSRPGRIRDINTHTLTALVRRLGGRAVFFGLLPDDRDRLRSTVENAKNECDLVLVSGGSSVGAADWTLDAFTGFPGSELLIHGVSISPGKPLIVVKADGKALFGLPGHTASAYVTFNLFVRPLLEQRLLGLTKPTAYTRPAVLGRSLASIQGREDWIRVRLVEGEGGLSAQPILGPSGLISPLARSDGFVTIPQESEGLPAGSAVLATVF